MYKIQGTSDKYNYFKNINVRSIIFEFNFR